MTFIFKRTLLNKKVLKLGILITGIALAVIAFITFYGQNVGNFVMSVDEILKERQVWMSTDQNFTYDLDKGINNKESMLSAEPVLGARDITYSNIDIKKALAFEKQDPETGKFQGSYFDENFKYICYRFYIQNQGIQTNDMTYSLALSHIKGNVDKAIRIMMITIPNPDVNKPALLAIEDEDEFIEALGQYQTFYMAKDDKDKNGNLVDYKNESDFYNINNYPLYPKYQENENSPVKIRGMHQFVNDRMVFQENPQTLYSGDKIMFAIFMWLEGTDPDTRDGNHIVGGKIKIQMKFNAIPTDEEKK